MDFFASPEPQIMPSVIKAEHIKPKYIDLSLLPRASGISKRSGGMGKKEASANAIPPSAFVLFGLFARDKTQLYISRI